MHTYPLPEAWQFPLGLMPQLVLRLQDGTLQQQQQLQKQQREPPLEFSVVLYGLQLPASTGAMPASSMAIGRHGKQPIVWKRNAVTFG